MQSLHRVEKSHFPMVHEALRKEISRLRISSERFLSAPILARSPARDDGGGGPHSGRRSLDSEYHRSGSRLPLYRHAAPLEMTMTAGRIVAGDFSAQSFIRAQSLSPMPARAPSR